MTDKRDDRNNSGFSLSVGTRRIIAYIVLVLLTILCLFWFYVLFVNATRSKAELNHGFTLIPSHYAVKNLYNLFHNSNLPILIATLRSADFLKFDMAQVYMFIFMAILPVIIVYLFMARSIVAGLTAGAVKG